MIQVKVSKVQSLVPVTIGDRTVILVDKWEGEKLDHRSMVILKGSGEGSMGSLHEDTIVQLDDNPETNPRIGG